MYVYIYICQVKNCKSFICFFDFKFLQSNHKLIKKRLKYGVFHLQLPPPPPK